MTPDDEIRVIEHRLHELETMPADQVTNDIEREWEALTDRLAALNP